MLKIKGIEFFKIATVSTTEEHLQERLSLHNLEAYSELLFKLEEATENSALIGGIWGEFTLERQVIKGGLRFSLRECPNALCWTVTTGYPPQRDAVVIHLTINRQQKAPDFVEEIEEFLEDHKKGLQSFFSKR